MSVIMFNMRAGVGGKYRKAKKEDIKNSFSKQKGFPTILKVISGFGPKSNIPVPVPYLIFKQLNYATLIYIDIKNLYLDHF